MIQGALEFFPVSSSFHLHIAKKYFSAQTLPLFDLVCHTATLTSALYFFRREFSQLLQKKDTYMQVTIALVPLFFGYFFFSLFLKNASDTLYAVGLFFSGSMLFASSYLQEASPCVHRKKTALFIGSMQTLALIPGVSRSGFTVSAALFRGWSQKNAVVFSFLLATPTILGGIVVELIQLDATAVNSTHLPPYLVGFFSALVTGSLSIQWIYWIFSRKNRKHAAYYLWILSSACLFTSLVNSSVC